MVLLAALIAVMGGESIGAVFGAFTAPMWLSAATTLIQLSPDFIAILERVIPIFAGVGKLIGEGVKDVVLGPLLSEGFKQWVTANGDGAIKMQLQSAKDY